MIAVDIPCPVSSPSCQPPLCISPNAATLPALCADRVQHNRQIGLRTLVLAAVRQQNAPQIIGSETQRAVAIAVSKYRHWNVRF